MMLDNTDPRRDGREARGGDGQSSELTGDTPENSVPTAPAPEPVHRWLDGEAVDRADLSAPDAEKHVKFWAKVNEETERRRRLKTPRGLDAIIMDKLEPPVVKDD